MLAIDGNLDFTLVADGPRDRALLPILEYVLRIRLPKVGVNGIWADLSRVSPRPASLEERVNGSVALYPCDLLFVHRDSEAQSRSSRVREINAAVRSVDSPVVAVIPVRMTEAWLLFDEVAIRKAAGNSNGKCEIALPKLAVVERLPDPKAILESALDAASDLNARRQRSVSVARRGERFYRVANLIQNFSPLRELPSFTALEDEVNQALRILGLL